MWINSIFCHYFPKNLKRRRFWATHINRKWTFCTLEPWFWTNFEANRLFKSMPTGLLKREKSLLLDQPCSKTSLRILPYTWLRMWGLWMGAAFVRNFCIHNGTVRRQYFYLLSGFCECTDGLLVYYSSSMGLTIYQIKSSIWSVCQYDHKYSSTFFVIVASLFHAVIKIYTVDTDMEIEIFNI